MVNILVQTAFSTFFGHYLGFLFGTPPDTREEDERIRRLFSEFLVLLSRNFESTVEESIRDALLDQNFVQIRTDTTTAVNLFRQYCYTVTQQEPRGEEASLHNASLCIESAYSRLQTVCDRFLEEPLPFPKAESMSWTKEAIEAREKAIPRIKKKIAILINSVKAVSSVRLLILAKRSERYPGLRQSIAREIVPALQNLVSRIDQHAQSFQPLRITCKPKYCVRMDVLPQPPTFGALKDIYAQHPSGIFYTVPLNVEGVFGIEFTLDAKDTVLAVVRYHASNFPAPSKRNLYPFPRNWTGLVMLPIDQSPNKPLPTRDNPGGPFTIPFQVNDKSAFTPPIGKNNYTAITQELTKRLIPNYETTERVELLAIRELAGQVAQNLLPQ